jgi:hypothetical protein
MYGWRALSVDQENALYVRTALTWIRTHPRAYAHLLLRKLIRLYGFNRAADAQGAPVPVAVGAAHAAVLLAAAAGLILVLPAWRRAFLLLALVVLVNATTLVFSGATRYAVPMMPALCLLAAVPIAAAYGRVRGG